MKRIYLLIIILITSCSHDNKYETLNNLKQENLLNLIISQNDLSFNLQTENNKINYEATVDEQNISSKVTIFNSENEIEHIINYSFNTNNEFWKLKQEKKVIEKAEEIISANLSNENIQAILNQLWEFNSGYSEKISTNSNPYLLSTINYNKSILASASRAIINNSECDCNIHPTSLIDKTNFSCQEEQFLEIGELKQILQDYLKENSETDESTSNLISYLNQSDEDSIRFDEYYSFFISKENYRRTLSNILNKNDEVQRRSGCSWYCVMGCGSSYGCCGNYSGCCLYRHVLCYVHDKICTQCTPRRFCLPGCKPDLQEETIEDGPIEEDDIIPDGKVKI